MSFYYILIILVVFLYIYFINLQEKPKIDIQPETNLIDMNNKRLFLKIKTIDKDKYIYVNSEKLFSYDISRRDVFILKLIDASNKVFAIVHEETNELMYLEPKTSGMIKPKIQLKNTDTSNIYSQISLVKRKSGFYNIKFFNDSFICCSDKDDVLISSYDSNIKILFLLEFI